jgi:ABC-2 type transport system permease protein
LSVTTNLAYVRFELRRSFRNRRFYVISLGIPVLLLWAIAAPQRHTVLSGTGLRVPLYYMVSLAAFGTMMAMLTSGVRIAGERQVGWTRQLRISPLSVRAYFRAKILTAYTTALLALAFLYLSGVLLGVRLSAGRWVGMTGLILIGLIPLAALGIVLGHLITTDSAGPTVGGTVSLLAFLGGAYFPITSGFLHTIGQLLPSWWIVQASHVAIDGSGWPIRGWITIGAWTTILVAAAGWAYRRDTGKV